MISKKHEVKQAESVLGNPKLCLPIDDLTGVRIYVMGANVQEINYKQTCTLFSIYFNRKFFQ